MKASSPQIEHLKTMLSLEEKRAGLQSELDALDARLGDLKRRYNGAPASSAKVSAPKAAAKAAPAAPAPKAAPAARRGKRSGRGELKGQIFSALEKAGAAGVKVLELAKELGTKPANIYAWFHAGTKRYPSIKKTGGGSYKLVGKAPAAAPAKAAKAPAPVKAKAKAAAPAPKAAAKAPAKAAKAAKAPKAAAPAKSKAAGRSPRGQLTESIVGALKSAGANGLNIKELSSKLNQPYRNLQVWFATTGKKNNLVKKIRPATYRLA